jgi:hypothetical protein
MGTDRRQFLSGAVGGVVAAGRPPAAPDLHKGLRIPHPELIKRQGYPRHMDYNKPFIEADGNSTTGLSGYVRDRGFPRCSWSALPPSHHSSDPSA